MDTPPVTPHKLGYGDEARKYAGKLYWSGDRRCPSWISPDVHGLCYLHLIKEEFRGAAFSSLGVFPGVDQLAYYISSQPFMLSSAAEYSRLRVVHGTADGLNLVSHVEIDWLNKRGISGLRRDYEVVVFKNAYVGVLFSDMVKKGEDLTGAAEDYAADILGRTTALNADAAENYARLGDYMEEVHSRGGFKEIGRANFVTITRALVERWATAREASAAARLAAHLVFDEDPWSPKIFEEAMEIEEDEQDKQIRLLRMAGLVFKRGIQERLELRRRREIFNAWKADATAPARAFCRATGLDESVIDKAIDGAVNNSVPMIKWAAASLATAGTTAVKVMACVASGGLVAATTLVAAGLLLDWYYEDRANLKLGCLRRSTDDGGLIQARYVHRAKELFSIGAAMSDEAYDTTTNTGMVRLDPFFHAIKNDVSKLRDDTIAQKMLTNAVLPPLLNSLNSLTKSMIFVPASISDDTMKHIQDAMPDFYYRVVNRNHSHPALWAVRRSFELAVARSLVDADGCAKVVMIGGNVRQVSKIPDVIANFGPELSGRDNSRHKTKGTPKQRALFDKINIKMRFQDNDLDFQGAVGVSFYAAHDISKQDYVKAAIRSGMRRHYVALNIPVIMMDGRITEWDDTVLDCRYVRVGDRLNMSPIKIPVAGYQNSFDCVMSWVKPIKPILGYCVSMSAIAQVGSSYLLEMDIGTGPQEAFDTIWRMPDAGHYVLHDLTRDGDTVQFYSVPAHKFDQTVKFVVQLNGAKNIVEATAGRILGLEAQIKIGGVTLERAWHMNHREFTSTMIHAIMCAGLSKGDALTMMGKLRSHFSDRASSTIWQKTVNGYMKLLSLQKDDRLPGKASRGASDYEVVSHWTSRQSPGSGIGVELPQLLTSKETDEGYHSASECGSTTGANAGANRQVNDEIDSQPCTDESQSEEGTPIGKEEVSHMSKIRNKIEGFFTVQASKEDTGMEPFDGFKPSTTYQCLKITSEQVGELMTESSMIVDGDIDYNDQTGSKSMMAFMREHRSDNDLINTLRKGREFPAPDRGLMSIVKMAFDMDFETIVGGPLHRFVGDLAEVEGDHLGNLQKRFYKEVTEDPRVTKPFLLVDGIAASAKTSVIAGFISKYNMSSVIVCPTNVLMRDWRGRKVGSCVTRHKLTAKTLRGRRLLVIDECYTYSRTEMFTYLSMAARAGCKVILLGDRRQQYEDGGELAYSDFSFYQIPTMRMCVSNTMPVDAMVIAKWAAGTDNMAALFQTRSNIVHSIHFCQKDQEGDLEKIMSAVNDRHSLVFKDRAPIELGYSTLTDEQAGFQEGKEESWLSTSRVQGLRTKHSLMLTSLRTKAEKWFAEQPGLLYVATSRHSRSMLCAVDQFDLNLLVGLSFENERVVDGRLALAKNRERFQAPMILLNAVVEKDSPILSRVRQNGSFGNNMKFSFAGPIRDDWRPWTRLSETNAESAKENFKITTDRLVGEETPYVLTDAVKRPEFASAMGLYSIRRPTLWDGDKLSTDFFGLSRLAVLQNSRDELLDQKNVIERTARPRKLASDRFKTEFDAHKLYGLFKKCFMIDKGEVPYTTAAMPADWAESRTSEFKGKLIASDFYGTTAFSTRSQGFLKTQVKVKLKRNFALEENYGQTVLASPADFNALFGPWSKLFLRNLRLSMRPGVVLDSGFSDKELAREFRSKGILPKFEDENYQADVSRQDTSHTPVTLRLFCKLMIDMGIPSELVELYELHSSKYEYQSMHAGLYRGEARYNLGSGDPFTLIRNIIEVLTVMLERFGEQMSGMCLVVKGDDFISDKIPNLLPVSVPEIRETKLTEDFNRPPYHAGRFFLDDDILPDPMRMVAKILTKRTNNIDRANQLAESFYDRYIPLTGYSYRKMQEYMVKAYSDFEPELPLAALDLYHAMRDRNLFYQLVCETDTSENDRLIVLDTENDCIYYAASWFSGDNCFLNALRHENKEAILGQLTRKNIPCYEVKGRVNDFCRRGVWLSQDHAWAVVGLTEYKERSGERE